jgi:hypothetical protein
VIREFNFSLVARDDTEGVANERLPLKYASRGDPAGDAKLSAPPGV